MSRTQHVRALRSVVILALVGAAQAELVAQSASSELKKQILEYPSGGPQKNGFEEANGFISYYFSQCVGPDVALTAELDVKHLVAGPYYWLNGRSYTLTSTQSAEVRRTPRPTEVAVNFPIGTNRLVKLFALVPPQAHCSGGWKLVGKATEYWADGATLNQRAVALNRLVVGSVKATAPLRNDEVEKQLLVLERKLLAAEAAALPATDWSRIKELSWAQGGPARDGFEAARGYVMYSVAQCSASVEVRAASTSFHLDVGNIYWLNGKRFEVPPQLKAAAQSSETVTATASIPAAGNAYKVVAKPPTMKYECGDGTAIGKPADFWPDGASKTDRLEALQRIALGSLFSPTSLRSEAIEKYLSNPANAAKAIALEAPAQAAPAVPNSDADVDRRLNAAIAAAKGTPPQASPVSGDASPGSVPTTFSGPMGECGDWSGFHRYDGGGIEVCVAPIAARPEQGKTLYTLQLRFRMGPYAQCPLSCLVVFGSMNQDDILRNVRPAGVVHGYRLQFEKSFSGVYVLPDPVEIIADFTFPDGWHIELDAKTHRPIITKAGQRMDWVSGAMEGWYACTYNAAIGTPNNCKTIMPALDNVPVTILR